MELKGQLNKVLASTYVLYYKIHNYHWNIEGEKFFTLHSKFEELYKSYFTYLDGVAERLRMLGHYPNPNLTTLIKDSVIRENEKLLSADDIILSLIQDFKNYIKLLEETIKLAESDNSTQNLINDILDNSNKQLWMLNSYSKK